MKNTFVNITPCCDECQAELVIDSIQIDMINCMYILFCECIMCGTESIILLQLSDFIEISQMLLPPEIGGENGTS